MFLVCKVFKLAKQILKHVKLCSVGGQTNSLDACIAQCGMSKKGIESFLNANTGLCQTWQVLPEDKRGKDKVTAIFRTRTS